MATPLKMSTTRFITGLLRFQRSAPRLHCYNRKYCSRHISASRSMSSITNRSVPQAAGNPFDLMAGTTSTPIDVLLEIIHNTDEFTMKAYCNKTELLCHTQLLSADDIQGLSRPQLIQLLERGNIPPHVYQGYITDEELRSAVTNLMLAVCEKMSIRELQGHLLRQNWTTVTNIREQLIEATRAWILYPWLPHFRIKRYNGVLYGRHLTERQLAEMKFFTVPQLRQMTRAQLSDLLAQRHQITDGDRQELVGRMEAFQEFVILRLFSDKHAGQFLKRIYWTSMLDSLTGQVCRRRCIQFLRHPYYDRYLSIISNPPTGKRSGTDEEDEALLKAVNHAKAYIDQNIPPMLRHRHVMYASTAETAAAAANGRNDGDQIAPKDYAGLEPRINTKSLRSSIPILAFDGVERLWDFDRELAYSCSYLRFWRLVSVICNHHYGYRLNEKACSRRFAELERLRSLTSSIIPSIVNGNADDAKTIETQADTNQSPTKSNIATKALSPLHHAIAKELDGIKDFDQAAGDFPLLFPREITRAPSACLHRWLTDRGLTTTGPSGMLRLKLWMFQEWLIINGKRKHGNYDNEEDPSIAKQLMMLRYPHLPASYRTHFWLSEDKRKSIGSSKPPSASPPPMELVNSAVATARVLFARMLGTCNIKEIQENRVSEGDAVDDSAKLFNAGEDLFNADNQWWSEKRHRIIQRSRPDFWAVVSAVLRSDHDVQLSSNRCHQQWLNQFKSLPTADPSLPGTRSTRGRKPKAIAEWKAKEIRNWAIASSGKWLNRTRHSIANRPIPMVKISRTERARMSFFKENNECSDSKQITDADYDGSSVWERLID